MPPRSAGDKQVVTRRLVHSSPQHPCSSQGAERSEIGGRHNSSSRAACAAAEIVFKKSLAGVAKSCEGKTGGCLFSEELEGPPLHAGQVILQPLSSTVPATSEPRMTLVTLNRSSGPAPLGWALPTKRLDMSWFWPAR